MASGEILDFSRDDSGHMGLRCRKGKKDSVYTSFAGGGI